MQPPTDPPTLEYATPEEKPVVPTNPVVGILGFLLYGGLFLLFSIGVIGMGRDIVHRRFDWDEIAPCGILFSIWLLTLWRASAALRGALRSPRGR